MIPCNGLILRAVGITRARKNHPLKSWGLRLKKKKSAKKAKVAVARKLAVVLLAMWRTDEAFRWPQEEGAKA
jgi:hypothetical protein